jgi:hypothetical protein
MIIPITPAIPAKMTVPVTQYIPPNGRRKLITTELDATLLPQYKEMVAAGFNFSAEILGTGVISLCIENEDYDATCELADNGPQVQEKMEQMLRNKAWTKPPDTGEE